MTTKKTSKKLQKGQKASSVKSLLGIATTR
jgi:hypothetical protein